jgi:hypothetical protein
MSCLGVANRGSRVRFCFCFAIHGSCYYSTFELFNCNLCNLGFLIGRDDVGVFYIFVSLLLDIH